MNFERGVQIGDYILQEKVGKGQFSVVWRAVHVRTGFEVAIKFNQQNDPVQVKRFRREAEVLRNLSHSHLVPFLGYDELNGHLILIMRYIRGMSLESLIYRSWEDDLEAPVMTPKEVLRILKPLAEGLDYIHSRGVIHRDLKPANILIEEGTKNVLISDFGLAKGAFDPSQTAAGLNFTGTLLYAPPEQISNAPLTPATDQYALGAIVYVLLTGRPPFQPAYNDPIALLGMHLNSAVVAPGRVVRNLPPALDEVVLRALEKDPNRRFASVKAFYQAFEDAVGTSMAGQTIGAVPALSVTPPGQFRSSNGATTTLSNPPSPSSASSASSSFTSDYFPSSSQLNIPPITPEEPISDANFRVMRGRELDANPVPIIVPGQVVKARPERPKWLLIGLPVLLMVVAMAAIFLVFFQADPVPRAYALLAGHSDKLSALAFSPDGKNLVSASADKTLKLWEVSSGQLKTTFTNHIEPVTSVSYAPDGKSIASGSFDKSIKIWDTATGQEKANLLGHQDVVRAVAYSPDGKTLASASNDKTIKLWDVASGKEKATLTGHNGPVTSLAYSPDGKTLASGSDDKTVKLWDVAANREKATLNGHTNFVSSVAFSPDGKTLASGSDDTTIKLWDVMTNKEKVTLVSQTQPGLVWSLTFSPDGKTLASGSTDDKITLWNLATNKEKATLTGHTAGIRGLAYSPDGKTLASGSEDKTIKLWGN